MYRSGRPKPGGMEETLEGGRGPSRAVAPLEREREREIERERENVPPSLCLQ
jgi:hypothetical protein